MFRGTNRKRTVFGNLCIVFDLFWDIYCVVITVIYFVVLSQDQRHVRYLRLNSNSMPLTIRTVQISQIQPRCAIDCTSLIDETDASI